jgi:tripartite-type tricarboxylate transporter receptor subunit TctC
MNVNRFVSAVVGCLFATAVFAQAYPARPVTFIVPWPPGGSTDLAMRSLSVLAEKHLGQRIVIENKPGVSGTMGAQALAQNARPDGYTIAQMPITVFRLPHMSKMAFDPMSDFTYIIHLTGYTFGVVVRADSPHKTWQDLVAWAKANPGKLTYATPGNGTSLHITMETIAQREGVQWTQVPYRGFADASVGLLGGQVMAHADSTGWAELVNSGRVRLLVTWGAARTKRWPNVPTLKELGYPIVSSSPFGIAGPKGMDPAAVKALHDAFKKALEEPEFQKTLEKFDQEAYYLNSADYAALAKKTFEEEREIVKRLGLKM